MAAHRSRPCEGGRLRVLDGAAIPDAYDFGRMLLGILIFWGIAATSYRGGHITVDALWGAVGPRAKRRSTSSQP